MDESLPRHAVEPESVIAEAVCAIEPDLDQGLVEKVITDTFRYSPQRRQLALLLQQDPAWPTDGRPESPPVVERFVHALRERGAQHVQPPLCGMCGQPRPLKGKAPDSDARICGRCADRRWRYANPCAICGRPEVRTRDRQGRPRCRFHPPDGGADPVELMCRLIQLY